MKPGMKKACSHEHITILFLAELLPKFKQHQHSKSQGLFGKPYDNDIFYTDGSQDGQQHWCSSQPWSKQPKVEPRIQSGQL